LEGYRSRVNLFPPGSWLVAFVAVSSMARAIEIRDYDEGDINGNHKWLLEIPGQFLWGHPPHVNPNFTLFPSSKLLGIGWPEDGQDWTRQIALVSPRHAVYATHYALNPAWKINYLGSDGLQHQIAIESQTPIINTQGQQTDLMLVTFTTPMTSAGVKPFKVLNLANEAAYQSKPLLVCGSFVTAGTTKIDGFTTLSNDPGFDTTRFLYFNFDNSATTASDPVHTCCVTPGDSGGPVIVMENGEPAIVGIISSYDDLAPATRRSYASSLPAYLPQLDTLMEAKGFHMSRFYPAATAVAMQTSATGALRPGQAGSATIQASNTGAATAHNLTLKVTFSSAPTSVSGTGWICEQASATVWNCRRGGLVNGMQGTLTASWNSIPNATDLRISTDKSYDGGPPDTTNDILPILQSYTSWVQGASDTAQNADPDKDGVSNLLEYAFGGAPSTPSPLSIYGHLLTPQVEKSGNRLLMKYPHRTDAAARGITEAIQYATSLTSVAWDTTAPSSTTILSAPFSPPSPGFEQVTVSVPVDEAKKFVRLKISLAE